MLTCLHAYNANIIDCSLPFPLIFFIINVSYLALTNLVYSMGHYYCILGPPWCIRIFNPGSKFLKTRWKAVCTIPNLWVPCTCWYCHPMWPINPTPTYNMYTKIPEQLEPFLVLVLVCGRKCDFPELRLQPINPTPTYNILPWNVLTICILKSLNSWNLSWC